MCLLCSWHNLAQFLETKGSMKGCIQPCHARHLKELKNQDLILIHNLGKERKGLILRTGFAQQIRHLLTQMLHFRRQSTEVSPYLSYSPALGPRPELRELSRREGQIPLGFCDALARGGEK